MTTTLRGADIVIKTLERAGHTSIFTLSGNHIMSLFDAAIDSKLELSHVRHEAATVHMADAYGRLTGKPGIAWVTGGPGHANAVGALFTAQGQESPVVLMSGHTETDQLGRGGFQELRQVEMAAPVTKASWMATNTATVGMDVAKAIRIATSGRTGPVHLSLPSDILDASVPEESVVWPSGADFSAAPVVLSDAAAKAILGIVAEAERPLVLASPRFANRTGRAILARIEATLGLPTAIMESPRGFNDATLGAFAEAARRTDLIVLLGKAFDFTLKFGGAPINPACKFISIDPEGALVERAARELGPRFAFGCVADTMPAAQTLLRLGSGRDTAWLNEARALMRGRPATWSAMKSKTEGKLHPAELFLALKPYVEKDPNTILICDGGEFAQWGQAILSNDRRMINGVAGSIGSSLPMAGGSRVVDRDAPVFAVLGDGTFGFHMAEFETAVRLNLPFIAVVGTDCRWNAEYNLQVRDYGPNRTFGCELDPTRYDQAVAAMGGHGELVTSIGDLPGAMARAQASGKPACINVMIESIPSPVVRVPAG
ncbi:MAG: thiamine pyrophosphate-binding protein [Acetobacteraceae bacterium]|nr:thiamine pyrophosphate-binding protein [Acetobacteraceae bacterium]